MIIAQVCLRLATMKGNSKMCSFTVSGGSGGVRKPVSIWCDHHLLHAVLHMECNTCNISHRVDQVFDWGLWNVGPVLFNGCAKLLDIGRNWNTLSYTAIQSIPNMLNGWHVRWVCWPCKNWDIFSFQELCADPCNKGLCIIMLQHEVMVIDEWHKNGPKDLVTVSLCIQNAINKMYLCLLSITPPPPWATQSTTLTSANRSPTQRNTRCLPSALYSENRDSSVKRTPLQSARHHRMWAFAHWSQFRRRTAVRSRPRWGQRPPGVRVAVLRQSWKWRCWMWRSWAGVVSRGLWLRVRLYVLPNSLKRL